MSAALGSTSRREALPQPVDDRRDVVAAQRRLRDACDPIRVVDAHVRHIRSPLDELHARRLAKDADCLIVSGIADQDHVEARYPGIASPLGEPLRPMGRSRPRREGHAPSPVPTPQAGTPWALKTTVAPRGTSLSSSTNLAPASRKTAHDTVVVHDGAAHVHRGWKCRSARSTVAMARTTPAQNPRGETSTTRLIDAIIRRLSQLRCDSLGDSTAGNHRHGNPGAGMGARAREVQVAIIDDVGSMAGNTPSGSACARDRELSPRVRLRVSAHDEWGVRLLELDVRVESSMPRVRSRRKTWSRARSRRLGQSWSPSSLRCPTERSLSACPGRAGPWMGRAVPARGRRGSG